MSNEQKPTNYRANRKRNERVMLWMVVGTLVGLGTLLIGAIWGAPAAVTGGICLGGGGGLILLLWGILTLLEKWVGE